MYWVLYKTAWSALKSVCVHAKLLQLCPTLCNPMGCSPPGSPVHGILQARILEWIAVSSSRGSSWPRNELASLRSPALAGGFFTTAILSHQCTGSFSKTAWSSLKRASPETLSTSVQAKLCAALVLSGLPWTARPPENWLNPRGLAECEVQMNSHLNPLSKWVHSLGAETAFYLYLNYFEEGSSYKLSFSCLVRGWTQQEGGSWKPPSTCESLSASRSSSLCLSEMVTWPNWGF